VFHEHVGHQPPRLALPASRVPSPSDYGYASHTCWHERGHRESLRASISFERAELGAAEGRDGERG
jgi:hypothetical protein